MYVVLDASFGIKTSVPEFKRTDEAAMNCPSRTLVFRKTWRLGNNESAAVPQLTIPLEVTIRENDDRTAC